MDVVGPDREELLALAREFELPHTVVEDCLDPEHLPKHEKLGEVTFLILRLWDRASVEDASTVQELTRKLSIFYRESFLLTVHRVDLEEVGGVRESCSNGVPQEGLLSRLLTLLINRTLDSYDRPLAEGEATADLFETAVFDGDTPPSLRQAHQLKRRVSLIRRVVYQTSTVLQKIVPSAERSASLFQDTRESADAYLFWADQLMDEVNQLLQVNLAMAQHRASEVMKVLTVFAAFFLPLTFIVGIYGMNFRHMPELEPWWGYPAAWVLMISVVAAVWVWFKRRGWM